MINHKTLSAENHAQAHKEDYARLGKEVCLLC